MTAVKDEQHLLSDCPFYSNVRGQHFSLFGRPFLGKKATGQLASCNLLNCRMSAILTAESTFVAGTKAL